MIDLLVRRDDFHTTRFRETETPDLTDGQVLFRIDRFALTSNNITYAAAGDMLDYWGFFPAEEGWGRIPVMGFADVSASRHPGVAEGERVFGFFPMATHLVIDATGVGETPHPVLPSAWTALTQTQPAQSVTTSVVDTGLNLAAITFAILLLFAARKD